jgi:membrane protein DedA with SNARE-associated domain
MTAACWIGYQLGAGAGRGAAHRLIRERDLAWLEAASERWGSGVIMMFRAVPVLAEASAIFAGMSRMRRGRFMALATLSNAGISAVYAAVGAYSASVNSFLLAFIAAMLLPGLALLAIRGARRQARTLLPGSPGGGERPL